VTTENVQKAHYEAIHDEYERHYYDATSLDYRRRFIFKPALKGLDLNGARIADVASGSGWNTVLMREAVPSASFHGFDISGPACRAYSENTGFPATECDLSTYKHQGEKFDAAIVIGGLHHMVNDLAASTATIADMVKPSGYLIAYEPNANFFLNRVRNAWYKADRYFEEETERALSLDELKGHFAGKMELLDTRAMGGPSYIAILNSLVMRIPMAAKKPLASILSIGEVAYNALPGSAPFPAFLSRWKRL
jgi:SAM-dependent methyltransferase